MGVLTRWSLIQIEIISNRVRLVRVAEAQVQVETAMLTQRVSNLALDRWKAMLLALDDFVVKCSSGQEPKILESKGYVLADSAAKTIPGVTLKQCVEICKTNKVSEAVRLSVVELLASHCGCKADVFNDYLNIYSLSWYFCEYITFLTILTLGISREVTEALPPVCHLTTPNHRKSVKLPSKQQPLLVLASLQQKMVPDIMRKFVSHVID